MKVMSFSLTLQGQTNGWTKDFNLMRYGSWGDYETLAFIFMLVWDWNNNHWVEESSRLDLGFRICEQGKVERGTENLQPLQNGGFLGLVLELKLWVPLLSLVPVSPISVPHLLISQNIDMTCSWKTIKIPDKIVQATASNISHSLRFANNKIPSNESFMLKNWLSTGMSKYASGQVILRRSWKI